MARYLIGIDLGTTNCALAYVDTAKKARGGRPVVQTFAVPQLVAPGEVAARPLLPSFLYLPGPHDLPAGATALPWDAHAKEVVGEFARQHGARVPGRLVSSAKSWLSHSGVDRSAALLPWGAPPDVPRLSPLDVSARYLRHLVDAWNSTHPGPDERLEKQAVVLTVPASFDDVARNLTVEAAKKAGLENVTLLEEPQAAFYCWIDTAPAGGGAELRPGSRCLVVDVGGGTSDFTLIEAVEQKGEMGFVRQAVGDHLLLGGDNMDLALARAAEAKLKSKLDAAQFGQLVQACRQAKEALLAPGGPASYPVTVMGRGRAVVGGTLTTTLAADEVRSVLFDGFFPPAAADAEPQQAGRAGLHEMGLPYVHDPAVTRHLAAFLRRHLASRERERPEEPPVAHAPGSPSIDAIVFNGGVFQPAALRDRLVDVMRPWYSTPGRPWQPLVLTTPSLDLAVAWGAAYYAWLRHTGGKRIGGGIARSYYVGIEREPEPRVKSQESGVKGQKTGVGDGNAALHVLCVVPRRLEENEEVVLPGPELELTLGQPVLFPLYTSTVRGRDRPGQVLEVAPEQLLQLPPLTTVLRGGKRAGAGPKQVPVTLAAKLTAIGTLELACVATDGGNRWRLEFNTREIVRGPEGADGEPAAEGRETASEIVPEALVQAAVRLIDGCFTAHPPDPMPQELTRALEAALEMPRHEWPTGLCRRLADALAERADGRTRSPAHRTRWFHLLGYDLRPGFGDPLDRFRIDQLWKLLHAPKPGQPAPPPEVGADAWIMWRRVGGGLAASLQQTLFDRARPFLLPGKGKAVARPGANELAEMWRAAASLERLDPRQKAALGEALVKQVRRSPAPTYAFWSLTRLGARVLLYGPLNTVLHPETVGPWLDTLLGFAPGHEGEARDWAFCLAQLARRSGQRALDVDDARRAAVLAVLRTLPVPGAWPRMVEEVVAPEGAERSQLFGESLPIGLRLR
jgi:DNA-K related protein/Hsp70 protein